MKTTTVFYVFSGILIFLGILFIAQSQSYVGPTQSFMHNNPEWSIKGSILITIGILILISYIIISIWKRKKL
jgi:ABC-type xylose transport system permease subunit